MKLKAIIVEDEPISRKNMTSLIRDYCQDIDLIGEAENILQAEKMILETQPHLIFLDIELPDGTGFDLLNKIDSRQYQIIFTTAYQEFAIQAIKRQAIDYLLKPIDIDDLVQAIERVKKNIENSSTKDALSQLSKDINLIKRIAISQEDGTRFVEIDQITYCKSDSNYSTIFLQDQSKILTTIPLSTLETRLEKHQFLRIHQSYLVNSKYITRYIRGEGGQIELQDGTLLDVSRRKRDELNKLFDITD